MCLSYTAGVGRRCRCRCRSASRSMGSLMGSPSKWRCCSVSRAWRGGDFWRFHSFQFHRTHTAPTAPHTHISHHSSHTRRLSAVGARCQLLWATDETAPRERPHSHTRHSHRPDRGRVSSSVTRDPRPDVTRSAHAARRVGRICPRPPPRAAAISAISLRGAGRGSANHSTQVVLVAATCTCSNVDVVEHTTRPRMNG